MPSYIDRQGNPVIPDFTDFAIAETDKGVGLMNERGEGLFVLEPGANGWGSAEDEAAYINAAISFLKGTRNAHNISVFSTFGEFYQTPAR